VIQIFSTNWAAREYPSPRIELCYFFTRRDVVEGAGIPSNTDRDLMSYKK